MFAIVRPDCANSGLAEHNEVYNNVFHPLREISHRLSQSGKQTQTAISDVCDLVVTYVCNTMKIPELITHPDIYVPQVIHSPLALDR